MASNSSPTNFHNGPSSPYNSPSSPIGNTLSSPGDSRRRRRSRSSPPVASSYASPPHNRSRFATSSEASPTPSRLRSRTAATPSSTDGESSEYYGSGDATEQMFVWGTNISVQDVNVAILRFLKNFREEPARTDSIEQGKYIKELDRVFEMEREWIDVDAMDIFSYDPDLYHKMVRYPLEVLVNWRLF